MSPLFSMLNFFCRLGYRQGWDKDFRDYLKNLDKTKPVILCGDLNVAHKEIGRISADCNSNSNVLLPLTHTRN